jgi:colicin import membrane protein
MSPAASYQRLSAGGMSLLVHILFVVFLIFGMSWHSQPQEPVEAELWSALPALPPPPVITPEPLAPVVEPAPVAPPPEMAPAKPDIALERAEKKRREEEARKLEQARRQDEARQEAEKLEAARQDAMKKEVAKQEAARKLELAKQQEQARQLELQRQAKVKQEQARRAAEQEIARQAREDLDAEDRQLIAAQNQQRQHSGRLQQMIEDGQDRIRSRIYNYLILPPQLVGNPEAVFRVTLLPNGEVLRADLLRSSGQAVYDREVERAILKASPLPLPADREAAAEFRGGLILKFRPGDNTAG